MDEEVALVSALAFRREVGAAIELGVEEHHFSDPDCAAVFTAMVEHKRVWMLPPSKEIMQRKFPNFPWQDTGDAIEAMVAELGAAVAYRRCLDKWRKLGDMLDQRELWPTLNDWFAEASRDLAVSMPVARASRFSDLPNRILSLKEKQALEQPLGIPLAHPPIDKHVLGIQGTEYVVFLAATGIGKTTGMIKSSFAAYEFGVTPMFVSLEMEQDELWTKFDSLAAGVSNRAIRSLELGEGDYTQLERTAQRIANYQQDLIVIDDIEGAPTVDRLAALAERYRPGIIVVDYVSLMSGSTNGRSDWERVTEISKGLKQLARSMRTPVYAAAQSNREALREGPTMDNIAYALGVGQDANVVIGYHQDEDMELIRQVEIRHLKNRNMSKARPYKEMWDRDRMKFETWTKAHEFAMKEQT